MSAASTVSIPLLSTRGLCVRLKGAEIISEATWELFAGDRLMIRGASGSGKSVMLRSITGLLPRAQGEIHFRNRDIRLIPATDYRARVVYVAQTPARFPGTVRDNLEIVRSLEATKKWCVPWEQVEHWMHTLHVAHLLDEPADQLSGGEAQRMGLVRALQLDPTVLLLDEPTSALDPALAHQVETVLLQWSTQSERAWVWITHNPAAMERLGTRVLQLENKRCIG